MNLTTLTGGVSIGKDDSGDFMLSIAGMAVKTRDGAYIANGGRQMVDVTDGVIEGSEEYIYRVPASDVGLGDLIITSDAPFSALFVQSIEEEKGIRGIRGIDPRTSRMQAYVQPTNIFNLAFFVKVIGVSDLLTRREDNDLSAILACLLLSGGSQGQGQGLGLDNPLTIVLLSQALSHGHGRDDVLPLLIAMSGTQDSNTLPLLLLASRFSGAFFHEFEEHERGEGREERARVDNLRLELAAERGRRQQAEQDLRLLAQMGEGQAETTGAVSKPENRPARRTGSAEPA